MLEFLGCSCWVEVFSFVIVLLIVLECLGCDFFFDVFVGLVGIFFNVCVMLLILM